MCKAIVIFIIIGVRVELKVKISASCCPDRQEHVTELAFLFAFYFLLFHYVFFSTLIFFPLRFYLILLFCTLPLYFFYYEVCLKRSQTNYTKHSTRQVQYIKQCPPRY